MKAHFSHVHWGRVLLTSVLVVILVLILNTVLLWLASHVWGSPSQTESVSRPSSRFLEHIHFGNPVDRWWCHLGCTQGKKRGSAAWLTHGPGCCSHSLRHFTRRHEFFPGGISWAARSAGEGSGNLFPDGCSWLAWWCFGQPRAGEVIAQWPVEVSEKNEEYLIISPHLYQSQYYFHKHLALPHLSCCVYNPFS